MSEEYSLDDFVPTDDEDGQTEPSAGDNPDESVDDTDPAVATSRWSSDGETCPDCDSTVFRLWRHENTFVCADCKEW
ncbi:hypothetical protein AArcSl_3104 [Halalkaliarchaeum desulfuricum]|uniref:DUF7573 domain-containing protein n=1 Tax=Halalkaliarchaeum desulfuricum TaxID=2055893 RepID=A0A343TNN9_9EURY|nr:hypothetical protein [Halalkaliarchaeum desulfuricum]AUX10711.1 hypothetical protein AArcSl_3104 [Halalkaliarchaeum desulfuricum]